MKAAFVMLLCLVGLSLAENFPEEERADVGNLEIERVESMQLVEGDLAAEEAVTKKPKRPYIL